MFNIHKMMKQAQQVQYKLQEMQEKFKDIEVEGEAGNGLVKVRMNCAGDLLSIDIDPSIIKAEEKETLEDLVVAAINKASDAKSERVEAETKKMMNELGLPEDSQLPM